MKTQKSLEVGGCKENTVMGLHIAVHSYFFSLIIFDFTSKAMLNNIQAALLEYYFVFL
jgi:hypothetical protein